MSVNFIRAGATEIGVIVMQVTVHCVIVACLRGTPEVGAFGLVGEAVIIARPHCSEAGGVVGTLIITHRTGGCAVDPACCGGQ